jgi:hypothetical protein
MWNGMDRWPMTARVEEPGEELTGTVRIQEECLQLEVTDLRELRLLRRWVGQVNGPSYPQPYLVEEPEGRFRLYVGRAAERVRTRQGMLE